MRDKGLVLRLVDFAYDGWPGECLRYRRELARELREVRAENPADFDATMLRVLAAKLAEQKVKPDRKYDGEPDDAGERDN